MNRALLCFVFVALLSGGIGQASVVIHHGREGIVAHHQTWTLDSMGRVWRTGPSYWERQAPYDPPIPLAEVKFWEPDYILTMNNRFLKFEPGAWIDWGFWPASSVPESTESAVLTAKSIPNPSPGACRISFSVATSGPVSLRIYDAGGRQVRELLEGSLPAGQYAPSWDGKEDSGNDAAAGIYFIKITTPSGESTGQAVLT